MRAHRFFRALWVPRPQRMQDFRMLFDRAFEIGARIDGASESAEELDLVLHALDDADQARVLRGMNEHIVKIAAETPPFARVLLAQRRACAVAVQLHLVMIEVLIRKVRTAQASRQRLESFAHMVNLDHVFDRVRRNERAFAFDHAYQPFAFESAYCFPHWRAADAQALS